MAGRERRTASSSHARRCERLRSMPKGARASARSTRCLPRSRWSARMHASRRDVGTLRLKSKPACAAGRRLVNEANRKWPFARDTEPKAAVRAASALVLPLILADRRQPAPRRRRQQHHLVGFVGAVTREHASFNECRMPDDVRVVPLCRAASSRGASFSAQQPIYAIRRAA